MKKFGIIFAMQEELEALKEYLTIKNEYKIFNLSFYEGIIDNTYCILVESGIGKVNAARTAQILIDNFKVDYIFNIGVAGGIDSKLKIGDIVIGEKLVQHDFDLTAFNHEKGYVPNVGKYIESDAYLCKTSYDILKENPIINSYKGVIASGDIFCTEEKMANKINFKFNALCTEMEGASIAQVCFLSNIPFLIIRSISDVPNNDNVITYEEFLTNSAKIVALAMKDIINKIDNELNN